MNNRNFMVDRNKFETKTGRDLFDILYKISNNDAFLYFVFSNLIGDKNKQKMIDVINSGITDEDQIVFYSMDIANGKI